MLASVVSLVSVDCPLFITISINFYSYLGWLTQFSLNNRFRSVNMSNIFMSFTMKVRIFFLVGL